MKDAFHKLTLIAALLVISGAAAYAQGSLYAKIPFEFRASGKLLPAGEYIISPVTAQLGVRIMELRKMDTKESAFLVQRYAVDTEAWRNPELRFGCLEGKCSLQKVYPGGYGGWSVGSPIKAGAHELQASVRLERLPAD